MAGDRATGTTSGTTSGARAPSPLTLRDAAETLGVHYMTAYRYVRTGRLPAVRGRVGWEVDPADLARVRPADERAAGVARRPRGSAGTSARLEARLLAGDEGGAWAVVDEAIAWGAPPAMVHHELLGPALRRIGDAWAAGELTIAQEHRASAVATRVVSRLGPRFARRGRTRGTVVVGTVAGDHHALPGAMLADLLRGEGFAVHDLGADVPTASFVEAARGAARLVAVVAGGFDSDGRARLRATVDALHDATIGAPVLVGGAAVASAPAADALGADGWTGPDGRTAVHAITAVAASARAARR